MNYQMKIKLLVARARKNFKDTFLSLLLLREQFTNIPGKYVKLEDTIRGFKMILNGDCDQLPESAFMMVGVIEEAFEKQKTLQA